MCLSQATYDSLSPDQRALAAEILLAHRMARAAPPSDNRIPKTATGGSTTRPKHAPTTQSGQMLKALMDRGEWLRAPEAGRLIGIGSSAACKAMHRLHDDGLVEQRRLSQNHTEWRAAQ